MTTTTSILNDFESVLGAVSVDSNGGLYANISIGGKATQVKVPGVTVDAATAQKISFFSTLFQLVAVGISQGHLTAEQVPGIQASFGF